MYMYVCASGVCTAYEAGPATYAAHVGVFDLLLYVTLIPSNAGERMKWKNIYIRK